MVAAIEKQKFVYVLNRDPTAALTISSPLEVPVHPPSPSSSPSDGYMVGDERAGVYLKTDRTLPPMGPAQW